MGNHAAPGTTSAALAAMSGGCQPREGHRLDRARGWLMFRYGLSAAEASAALLGLAVQERASVGEVAEALLREAG